MSSITGRHSGLAADTAGVTRFGLTALMCPQRLKTSGLREVGSSTVGYVATLCGVDPTARFEDYDLPGSLPRANRRVRLECMEKRS